MKTIDVLLALLPCLKTFTPALSVEEQEALSCAALSLDDGATDLSGNVTAAQIVRQIQQPGAVVNAVFPALIGVEGLLPRWMTLVSILRVSRAVATSDSAAAALQVIMSSSLDNHLYTRVSDAPMEGWSL